MLDLLGQVSAALASMRSSAIALATYSDGVLTVVFRKDGEVHSYRTSALEVLEMALSESPGAYFNENIRGAG